MVVQALSRILFEMQPFNADRHAPVFRHVQHHLALADNGLAELRYLIALGQIGIKIILAVEHRVQIDLGLETEARAHRLRHAFLVYHGQHAGHGGVDKADLGIGLRAKFRGRAGKQFRP